MQLPKKRNPKQPYILWSLESPANDHFRPGKNVINWTMTPRRDADIWYPYGHLEKLDHKNEVDYEEIWNMKSSTLPPATWLASNCFAKNRRTELVKELEGKGLKIDRWGRCGKTHPTCFGVEKQGYPCVQELVRPYKFYISIENTNCIDYVTEKFYETLYSRMAVPIVLAREYYQKLGIPDDSYIAIDDFENLEDLAAEVNKIANDKQLYLKYHKWRETYRVIPEHHDSTGFCELCRRLQLPIETSKSYEDVNGWHTNGMCNQSIADKYLR
ncbi:hypothetical protein WR25_05174 isoform B [Diploscapter pachys]|nr:hypothetical protein WR25_05174 isoform B [Diploscapter pachys]